MANPKQQINIQEVTTKIYNVLGMRLSELSSQINSRVSSQKEYLEQFNAAVSGLDPNAFTFTTFTPSTPVNVHIRPVTHTSVISTSVAQRAEDDYRQDALKNAVLIVERDGKNITGQNSPKPYSIKPEGNIITEDMLLGGAGRSLNVKSRSIVLSIAIKGMIQHGLVGPIYIVIGAEHAKDIKEKLEATKLAHVDISAETKQTKQVIQKEAEEDEEEMDIHPIF